MHSDGFAILLAVRFHTEENGLRSKVESRHNQTIVGELGFFLDEPRYAVSYRL